MNNLDHAPTYNVKAVVKETGLKPDTLRAWERRYGLPNPQRTAGGHRLYAQRDIDILKWLVARQHEGLSVSRAVELWQKLETNNKDPLTLKPLTVGPAKAEKKLAELREAWISACLAFGELGAEQALTEALALYPLERVCTEILQTGLVDIGRSWHEGEVSAQQEHFASNYALKKLEALMTGCPTPTRPGKILIGTPTEEEHTIGTLLLTLFLCRQGWETVYLGSNVSLERLRTTTLALKPDLVILSAQQLSTAARVVDLGQMLHGLDIPLAFGGLIFNRLPSLQDYMPGYFLGEKLDQAVQWVDDQLDAPGSCRPKRATKQASDLYRRTLAHYLERQGAIETDVWQAVRSSEVKPASNYIIYANKNLARNIMAALTLGDLNFLDPAAIWVDEMLGHYRLSADLMPRYLQLYHKVAKNHLDECGQPLVKYLDQINVEKSQK